MTQINFLTFNHSEIRKYKKKKQQQSEIVRLFLLPLPPSLMQADKMQWENTDEEICKGKMEI